MNEHVKELDTKIWKTKGSRFNAYRRLTRRHRLSSLATSLMSVYVIFLALVPSVLPADSLKVDPAVISMVTAFIAVAILVISLLEYARSYELHAENLHQNARQLSRLYDELREVMDKQFDEKRTGEEIEKISERYHEILNSISENHEPGDYDLFRSQNPAHFSLTKCEARIIRIRETIRTSFLYYLAMISLPLLILIIWLKY